MLIAALWYCYWMNKEHSIDRYKLNNGKIVVEIVVKNSRQLFNERDPAPFRERDLDEKFSAYLVSVVQEFSIQTKMQIRILMTDKDEGLSDKVLIIREAIRSYFQYESKLARFKLKKQLRAARFFSLIGFGTLVLCLSAAQFINSNVADSSIGKVVSVGFVIIGWVAMWHPIESLLYDWWPIREQRRYFDKISTLDVDVVEQYS